MKIIKTRELKRLQAKFRVLKEWDIRLVKGGWYSGCVKYCRGKRANIWDLDSWYGKKKILVKGRPKAFFFHELLHIALREIKHAPKKEQHDLEEILIQDICKMTFGA